MDKGRFGPILETWLFSGEPSLKVREVGPSFVLVVGTGSWLLDVICGWLLFSSGESPRHHTSSWALFLLVVVAPVFQCFLLLLARWLSFKI